MITLDECKLAASRKQGQCLSEKYTGIFEKMLWKCKFGHLWLASFHGIKRGHWCHKCSNDKHRLTLKCCKDFVKKYNGLCLETEYKNNSTKMKWACSHGHEWFATFRKIKEGRWCRKCANDKNRLTLEYCQSFVKSKYDGQCLSTKYIKASAIMKWKCDEGHVWNAAFNHVHRGSWCPQCSVSKKQRDLFYIVRSIFNLPVEQNVCIFDWLRHKSKLEIDIYVPELKIAIEYDGIQHFESVSFFGGQEALKETKMRDRAKNRLIKKHIVDGGKDIKYFIRFKYKEPITEQYVREKLTKNGIIGVNNV